MLDNDPTITTATATLYSALAAISAAGNTDVTLAVGPATDDYLTFHGTTNGSRKMLVPRARPVFLVTVSAGSAAYTATVTLKNTSAVAGDSLKARVAMPASTNPTIEVRNLTSVGTLLATLPIDAALAREWELNAFFDGTNWKTSLQPAAAARAASFDELLSAANSRSIKDCLYSDGATSNRRVEWTLGAAGAVGGLPISIPFEFDEPTSNPGTSAEVFDFTSTATAGSSAYGLRCFRSSDGHLWLFQYGASTSDYRRLQLANFQTTYSGQKVRGMWVFASPNTSTIPKLYINSVDVSASLVEVLVGTYPNYLPTSLETTKYVVGLVGLIGRFVPDAPILGALTAAEVAEWTQTGRQPTWCEIGTGSASNLHTANASFESGTTSPPASWTQVGNHVATSLADGTAPDGANVVEIVASGAGAWATDALYQSAAGGVRKGGAHYQLTFWAKSVSGSTGLRIRGTPNDSVVVNGTNNLTLTTAWVKYTVIYRATTDGTHTTGFFLNAAGTVRLDDVRLIALGPLFRPVIQPCRIVDDAGSNGISGVITSGITPITTKRDWRMRATVDMSSTGNKQLFGAAVFENPTAHAVDSIEADCTGTPTLNGIGDGTTATKYAGSHALSAGRTRLTLSSTPFPADSAKTGIYANVTVTGGSTEKLIVRGHRID